MKRVQFTPWELKTLREAAEAARAADIDMGDGYMRSDLFAKWVRLIAKLSPKRKARKS